MKYLLILLIVFGLIGCNDVSKPQLERQQRRIVTAKKAFSIGEYELLIPTDFQQENIKGIDSGPGILSNGFIHISFDHGYYSNRLALSKEEHLNHFQWWNPIVARYMPSYNSYDKPEELKIIRTRAQKPGEFPQVDNTDFVVEGKLDTVEFAWPITLSEASRKHNVSLDTLGSVIKKIVTPVDPHDGYFGLHIFDSKSINSAMNAPIKLTMVARDTIPDHQEIILEIFNSVKKKE